MVTVKIRHKMPETNSSSSHSLAIYRNDPNKQKLTLKLNDKNEITIPDYSDFGWGWEYILDPGIRACYVISCICGLYGSSSKQFNKHKDRFERIVKDYTGAVKINYGWAPKGDEGTIKSLAPTVDHQSIVDMYVKISITDDSLRDFIFSNQSYLIIGGEDVPPLDIMLKENPNTDYKVFITFRLNSEPEINKDITVKLIDWPGGEKIREIIEDLSNHFYYSEEEKSFVVGCDSWWDPKKEEKSNYSDYCIFHELSEVRYYKRVKYDSFNEAPPREEITDYKIIKFDIIRL